MDPIVIMQHRGAQSTGKGTIRLGRPMASRFPIGWTAARAILAIASLVVGCGRSEPAPSADISAESGSPSAVSPAVTLPAVGETDLAEPVETSIRLEVSGPATAVVAEKIRLTVTVANTGAIPADGLSLHLRLDPGLEPADDRGPQPWDLDDLASGQTEEFGIEIRPTRSGPLSHTVEIVRSGKVLASEWSVVTATDRSTATVPAGSDRAEMADEGPIQAETEPPAAPQLPTPLGYQPDELQLLHPRYPVWVTRDAKSVVLVTLVCQRRAPLETFACLQGTKEHESVVVVNTAAYVVHAGLQAAGAEAGSPACFYPQYAPARGPEIEITMIFRDSEGQLQRARGQDWVRDMETGSSMQHPWVFAGSHFVKDEQTGEEYYQADGEGALICLSNFPGAVLDVPIQSSDSAESLLFEAFTEKIPPLGTPVTMVLTPKPGQQPQTEPQTP